MSAPLGFYTAEPLTRLAPPRWQGRHTQFYLSTSQNCQAENRRTLQPTLTVCTVMCGGQKKKRVKISTWTRWVRFSFWRRYCRPSHSGLFHDTPANFRLLPWSTVVLPLVKEKERKILIALSLRAALLFLIRLTFAVRLKESKGCNIWPGCRQLQMTVTTLDSECTRLIINKLLQGHWVTFEWIMCEASKERGKNKSCYIVALWWNENFPVSKYYLSTARTYSIKNSVLLFLCIL